jgi:uncharacterized protein YndB with AHSA1/START domain
MTGLQDLGHIRRVGDTAEITFHRQIARPVDRVWAALTVPERIADWFAEVERLELRLGGALHLHFPAVNYRIQATIVALEPPRLIAWTWPKADGSQSTVRFELAPDGEGCRLTLTETDLVWSEGAGNGAGWHAHLQAFEDACDGVHTPWPRLVEREQAVSAAYKTLAPV